MESVQAENETQSVSGTTEEAKSQLLQRQGEERKELLKSYERKKSFIPRKDRAGRSRLAEEQASDEQALQDRHAQERKEAGITYAEEVTSNSADVSGLTAGVETLGISGEKSSSFYGNANGQSERKESRAARRRRLKAEQEAESERRVAEARANMGKTERQEEMEAIQKQLDVKLLRVHPIAPDGHCLYNAVAHQMKLCGHSFTVEASVGALRNATADYMMAHSDDFIMFVESANGDFDKFNAYCEELRSKVVWGGQVEIRALAELLDVTIEVYVAYMNVLQMGKTPNESDTPVLRVSYHQKYYGLGEHYNSIVPRSPVA